MIKLFDVENGRIVPTEHCFTLNVLKQIMKDYPEEYMDVYAYLFYMTCPNPDINPFFDVPENEKEELIFSQLSAEFSTEDDLIVAALEFCKKLYETPTYRAFMGIKHMLDRLARYMENTPIEHGRDGNINSLINAAAKFEQIRFSFKGAYKDLMEEQKSQGRGGQHIAYDQS
jgi:uncharacterized protein YdgA (DUF945 family)